MPVNGRRTARLIPTPNQKSKMIKYDSVCVFFLAAFIDTPENPDSKENKEFRKYAKLMRLFLSGCTNKTRVSFV